MVLLHHKLTLQGAVVAAVVTVRIDRSNKSSSSDGSGICNLKLFADAIPANAQRIATSSMFRTVQ